MSKRKVLFITPSLCQGGIEHSQILMLNMLDKNKYDITLFLYLEDLTLLPLVPKEVKVVLNKDTAHYFRRPKAVWLQFLNKVCSILNLKNMSLKLSERLRLYIHEQKAKHPAKKMFTHEKFDVVISNAVGICTEMALYIPAEKHYVFFRSSVDLHHDLLAKLFPKYTGIIAVSEGVRQMLCQTYPEVKNKIMLLENYVDAAQIYEKANSKEDNMYFDLAADFLLLCSCGRLSKEKGFDMAVEAASILDRKGYKFKWYFLGDGDERKYIEELIQKYSLEDKVIITGFMDNPFPVIKKCDIYVQPSYEESYGRTIKEALILGRPVVSTETVGGKTVLENGRLGKLAKINAQGVAEAVEELIADNNLRESYRDVYNLEKNLEEKQLFKSKLEAFLD